MKNKILIMEDDTALAQMLTLLLTKEGYLVQVASDGPSALDSAAMWLPDLVLVDVMVPGMHGFDVVRRLREMPDTANTSIIIVSALARSEDKIRGFEAGADDYVTKPFDNAELLARINLRLRRSRDDTQPRPTTQGKLIAVFSLRGGSGCTSLAVNVATGLSLLWRMDTVLVDLALPIGSCDVLLNLKPRNNLGGLVQSSAAEMEPDVIEAYLVPHESGVQLLGGVVNPTDAERVTDEHATAILQHLKGSYPYLVVDTPHHFSGPALAALEQADVILVPIPPDVSSVRVTLPLLSVLDQLGFEPDKVWLILNTLSPSGLDRARIEKVLGHRFTCVIPYDPAWGEAGNLGRPLMISAANRSGLTALEDLVWALSRSTEQDRVPHMPSDMWRRLARRKGKS